MVTLRIFLKGIFNMLIINAKIVTMDRNNTVIDNGYIKTTDGKISEIDSMDKAEAADEPIFDVKGAGIYPGFVDAHTHLGMFEDSITFEGDDGNEDTDPITPNLRAVDGANPLDRYFAQALAAGVTTVLISPGSTNPIAGEIAAVKTKGRRIDNMIIKAPAAIKMSLGENPKSSYNDKNQMPVTRMAIAALIRETLTKAKKYYQDQQSYYNDRVNEVLPEYDAKYESLIPLFKKEIPAHFHAHRADDIFTALRIAREFDIECVIVHATDGHLIVEELKDECKGVLSGPFMTDRSKPELKNLTPVSPGIMSDSGIPTAIITDHPETPIQYLPLCAAVAVREGMDEIQALRAITITPAEICGIADRVGSIEIGKDADFIVLDGSPLDITKKPSAVFVDGVLADSELL